MKTETFTEAILRDITRGEEEMIAWRRDFHRHPEIAHQEKRTAAVVTGILEGLGLVVRTGVGGYGVVAELKGHAEGETIALRAELDALPMKEETGSPYASEKDGAMHSCGHDGHLAALLGTAKVLASYREELTGTIRLIFQPAEEATPGGALQMISEGALEGVDAIYGAHLWTGFPTGTLYTATGPITANSDRFLVEVMGHGGHAAQSHELIDVILVASQYVGSVHHIISRHVNPLNPTVISFGQIQAGTVFNVVPDRAYLQGTVRSTDRETRALVESELKRKLQSVCDMYGASYKFSFDKGHPAVINDEQSANLIKEAGCQVLGEDKIINVTPVMIGEDFSYYLQNVPGAFCFIGAGMNQQGGRADFPHHHPKFDFNEKALANMAGLYCSLIANRLHKE